MLQCKDKVGKTQERWKKYLASLSFAGSMERIEPSVSPAFSFIFPSFVMFTFLVSQILVKPFEYCKLALDISKYLVSTSSPLGPHRHGKNDQDHFHHQPQVKQPRNCKSWISLEKDSLFRVQLGSSGFILLFSFMLYQLWPSFCISYLWIDISSMMDVWQIGWL